MSYFHSFRYVICDGRSVDLRVSSTKSDEKFTYVRLGLRCVIYQADFSESQMTASHSNAGIRPHIQPDFDSFVVVDKF